MVILGYIIFAAGLVFFIWAKRADWQKSALQPLHLPSPAERNLVTRGKDGYFDQKRSYIVSGAVIAIFTAAAIFTPWEYSPILIGGLFAAWALYVKDGIRKDIEAMKQHEAQQRAMLSKLRSDPSGGHLGRPTSRGHSKGIHWVYGTFYDFSTPAIGFPSNGIKEWPPGELEAEEARAIAIMHPRLVALSQRPETEWFKIGRNK